MQKEKQLHQSVCDYIRWKYPKVLFFSELSGSMRLSIGQATQLKRLRSNRGFPDLICFEPRGGRFGLFIEIKAEGEVLKKKNGEYKTEHLQEQHDVIVKLNELGYCATFGVGIDDCVLIIDNYMKIK